MSGTAAAAPDEIAYRIRWRGTNAHPGAHRSRLTGNGDEFRGIVPLTQGRDARRLDLRAGAIDPWGRPWVREFRQRGRVPIVLLADLSRSMSFAGHVDRLALCARFAQALAASAFRLGDPFGFVGCNRRVVRELSLAPSRSRQSGLLVRQRLEAWRASATTAPEASGTDALADAARWLPGHRSLVFLLSDLHLDAALFERTLKRLALHEVVVVLLADSAEREPPSRWGWMRLADLESGRERLVWLRASTARRLAAVEAARIDAAHTSARRHGASLIVVRDDVDPKAISRHFLAPAAA